MTSINNIDQNLNSKIKLSNISKLDQNLVFNSDIDINSYRYGDTNLINFSRSKFLQQIESTLTKVENNLNMIKNFKTDNSSPRLNPILKMKE